MNYSISSITFTETVKEIIILKVYDYSYFLAFLYSVLRTNCMVPKCTILLVQIFVGSYPIQHQEVKRSPPEKHAPPQRVFGEHVASTKHTNCVPQIRTSSIVAKLCIPFPFLQGATYCLTLSGLHRTRRKKSWRPGSF